jgi:hypothetical protein
MAFVWIQQWVPLPIVYEQQHMGDVPSGSRPQAMDNATTGFAQDGNLPASFPVPLKSPDNNAPFYSQLCAIPQAQLRQDFRSPTHYQSQEHGASPLNMSPMVGALPDFGAGDDASTSQQTVPRSLSGASTSAVAYQLGQNLQMPTHIPPSGLGMLRASTSRPSCLNMAPSMAPIHPSEPTSPVWLGEQQCKFLIRTINKRHSTCTIQHHTAPTASSTLGFRRRWPRDRQCMGEEQA